MPLGSSFIVTVSRWFIASRSSAAGRIGITAVAIAARDTAVEIMDTQLGTLVSADFPPSTDSVPFRAMMARCALATAALDIPAAGGCWNDVMSFETFFRHETLLSYNFVRLIERDRLRLVNDKFVRYTPNKAKCFNLHWNFVNHALHTR